MVWSILPAEIRLMILSTIAQQKYSGWASLASVGREWQQILEKVNFYKIRLGVACLDEFESIISPQKREMIQHICLNIELARCMSKCCSRRPSPSVKISSVVSGGIWKLFSIHSTWEPASELALEINVHSPSDCEHWFKNIHLSSDDTERDEGAMSDAGRAEILHHDIKHGWKHGQQVKAPPRSAILRLFRPIQLVFQESLPRVKAVTSLIIRRQLRRCINTWGLGLLLSRLDHLKHISYEPWVPYEASYKEFYDRGLLQIFMTNFQDVKFTYPGLIWSILVKGSVRFSQRKVLKLQYLAISFMVNAEEFFRYCQPTWRWSCLQSLALTPKLLQDDGEERSLAQ
ncbi:hypothetical protein BX600DRAFT_430033 [Xylariales sp. PMI_506]|nr:hypothetical protein BX600DRAFT_430033 [Xylariales sp. PMI_506]